MGIELYSIGEIAKIFDLSIQTLRYYEQTGLFIPAKKSAKSGYRYYTWDQFERLRLIIYLKDLGMSLKDIKHQLDVQIGEEYLKTLERQIELLEKRIQADTQLKRHIANKIDSIKLAREMPQNTTRFMFFRETKVLKSPCSASNFHEHEYAVVNLLRKYRLKTGLGRIGQIFSPTSLKNQNGEIICSALYVTEDMFTEDTTAHAGDAIITIPEGTYAVLFYREPTEKTLPYIYQLLDDIEMNSFVPCGDIYRIITSDIGRDRPDMDGYQAYLRILVRKKQESDSAGYEPVCQCLLLQEFIQ